ncbi:MAG: hypothetical protein ABDI19_07920, partial [Armatimonadota bacterium]
MQSHHKVDWRVLKGFGLHRNGSALGLRKVAPRSASVLAMLFVTLVQLAYASPFTPGNILVSVYDRAVVYEYTPSGVRVQTIPVPYPGVNYGSEYVRDLVVGPDGNLHVYNGTFDPYLSTYNPYTSTWVHRTYPGWSTANVVGIGGITAYQQFVYVTDMFTFGNGGQDVARGIVRFNLADSSGVRFADTIEFIDLVLGWDGLLYALDATQRVYVYDPVNLNLLRRITLSRSVRAIAVNAAGEIFGVPLFDPVIYRFNQNGTVVDSLNTGFNYMTDIDLSVDGKIVVGSWFGNVFLTDESLDQFSRFFIGEERTLF